jgi:energy-coupling factor transporter ATP-binding protein EcfA2
MQEPLISAIRIQGLFGMYAYNLPEEGILSNAAILYGDNGFGKSTILRLAFHLLSAATNRGHRNALFDTYFHTLEVDLHNGVLLGATRHLATDQEAQGKAKKISLYIKKDQRLIALWDWLPGSLRETAYKLAWDERGEKIYTIGKEEPSFPVDSDKYGEEVYIDALAALTPTTFILNADRRLDSDSVSDPSDEMELRRVMRFEEPKRINELVVRSREIALSQAINSAARWISRKAVHSANRGSENVHQAYSQVLKHLVSSRKAVGEIIDINDLQRQLSTIEAKTAEFAKYELSTPLSVAEFKKSLNTKSKPKSTLAAGLLKPYIDSLNGRLAALDLIYELVDKFVGTVNGFLSDKKISYKVSQGFSVQNAKGFPLDWGNLSSGEQQLLLLFCYVLTGRDKPCVFIIDEPEISLNVKWQRQLIRSLLDITQGSEIQFIFASHSMELLAQHRQRVVRLVNKND